MSAEQWKDIAGFEGRYQVSDMGRIKSLAFRQRYLLRTGVAAYRLTREKILATQLINSGYLIVHLHLNAKRTAKTIHRLVAEAFLGARGTDVNHKNGVKTDNWINNLEWCTSAHNHDHAVDIGLNVQAFGVQLVGGDVYPSVARAARQNATSIGTITRSARRGIPTSAGLVWEYA